jgi:NSS family neurotransmitter:Na+ symporter
MEAQQRNTWSSKFAFYMGTVGAAVGLGSVWRFPYLAGAYGGCVFIAVFLAACLLIATPLLVAEFLLGRWSRRCPPEAAGAVAFRYGLRRHWDAIGWFGTLAAFLIFSYYTMLAGWVSAYAWKCASGEFTNKTHSEIIRQLHAFLADPLQMFSWQVLFTAAVATSSTLGVNRGIEVVSKLRAPALLIIFAILVAYSLRTGDVSGGLAFAFMPDLTKLSRVTLLVATGQAFYATGVGMAMMIAYGAYAPSDVPLVRSSLIIAGSIILVSILATLFIFPLVFRYHMDPAEGPDLVFNVLPTLFSEMPGGRLIGTLFFVLLILAAFTPSIALMEPAVAWCQQRGLTRPAAAIVTVLGGLSLGLGSVWSFNYARNWHPLARVPLLSNMTFFSLVDFLSANVLLPVGALLTSLFFGWKLWRKVPSDELPLASRRSSAALQILLRYICPIAILAVVLAALS